MQKLATSLTLLLLVSTTVFAQYDFGPAGLSRARRATYTYNGASYTYPYYRNGATFSAPTNGYNNNGQYYYNSANTQTYTGTSGQTFNCHGGYTYGGVYYPYCGF
ncbi:unnamed protein product, partial [Mesorhabditis belari]|uniref:Uncharacterized protein n=1 Tax=Mesorhabditis belari TaxID=2138241 RepID=A0AAF3FCJ5_9BILA